MRVNMEQVCWGIVGVGDVCEVKSGPCFQKCKGSTLVAVMRRTAEKAKDFAKRHGVPRYYTAVEDLLKDPAVNAVYIATPPGSHFDIAMKCLEAKMPTYIEKPTARNADETKRIVDAFQERSVPLFVAYYRRGQPKFCTAKKVVETRLGRVTAITYSFSRPAFVPKPGDSLPWRFQAAHSGGGLIMDVGVHTVDIIDYICGPIERVCGFAANAAKTYSVEDTVSLTGLCRLATGESAIVNMHWNCACAPGTPFEDKITIRGTNGEVSFSTFGSDGLQISLGGVEEIMQFEKPKHAHFGLVQSIVDELRGVQDERGNLVECPSKGSNALRCARVIDSCLLTYYGNRDDAFWLRQGSWPGELKDY